MAFEIDGKIIAVGALQRGESSRGAWQRQEFTIETFDNYPRRACFQLRGDRIDLFRVEAGQKVRVGFDINAREYNGRWYNDVTAWNVSPLPSDTRQGQAVAQPAPQTQQGQYRQAVAQPAPQTQQGQYRQTAPQTAPQTQQGQYGQAVAQTPMPNDLPF